VQRLFTMFPPGRPGLALLLLRVSTGFAVLLVDFSHRQPLSGYSTGAAILVSAALLVGYLTPIAALAALAFHLIFFGLFGGDARFATILCLDALALALVGPGAYSVDSYLFGRRLVVLPPSS
jgi:uncharacterized membrane protein YphA (DoxX/SURF4 family)